MTAKSSCVSSTFQDRFDQAVNSAELLWDMHDVSDLGNERIKAKLALLESLTRDPNIKGNALKIACRIVFKYHNFSVGYAYPSVKTLAKDLDISDRTAERAVQALREDPHQRILVKMGGRRGSGGTRMANEYAIDWSQWTGDGRDDTQTTVLSHPPDKTDAHPRQICR